MCLCVIRLLQGEFDNKRGSFSHFTLYINASAMTVNNLLGNCQTYPRSLLLGRKKGIENPAQEILRDSMAIIANFDPGVGSQIYL
jgi:hypothetical protein